MLTLSGGVLRASLGSLVGPDPPHPQAQFLSSASSRLPVKSVASSKDALNLPHPGVLFTKQSCRGVRASGEQARWKGRGQEAGPKGGDPGENRRLNIFLFKSGGLDN